MNFRYPNITGRNETEQIAQIRSFLHQLVDQLNYAIPKLGDTGNPGADGKTPVKGVDYFTEVEIASVAKQAAQKISFTLDEDGNLYYEVEE
jgi:hypothetical protein